MSKKYIFTATDAKKFNKHGINLTVYEEGASTANVSHVVVKKGHFQEFLDTKSYYIYYIIQGKGFQTEAVKTLTDFAFEELGFNELYANTAPANEKSQNVLLRAGYNEETGFNEKNEAVFTLKKAA